MCKNSLDKKSQQSRRQDITDLSELGITELPV
jgi:hypothetical protein